MARNDILNFDPAAVSSPCFVVDQALIERNCRILKQVKDAAGCKILLAQKGFSMFALYPLIAAYLDGTCASSPHEARLGREEFGGEVHVFAAGYSERDMDEIIPYADHIVFNSFTQLERFRATIEASGRKPELAIRVNPEHSEGAKEIYDPCQPFSRLGVTRAQFRPELLEGVSGLHFHTLCEQNADPLERTLAAFEKKFGEFIPRMKYINFGGGHHITRDDYDIELLVRLVRSFRERYGVEVYLEPGEAIALNAGFLVARVLDVIENGMHNAILDTSAAAHMPDVIEMPYRPHIIGSAEAGAKPYTYRLGGLSCLAGDIIGDYSFDEPLACGSTLVFCDMAIYSMVKTNTFNGLTLPSIAICDKSGTVRVVRRFGYEDFKHRLS